MRLAAKSAVTHFQRTKISIMSAAKISTSSSADAPKPTPVVEKAKPVVMAFLRNGHEVLRGGMQECKNAVSKKDLPALSTEWAKLIEWQRVHACMEEGREGVAKGFFAVLESHFPGNAEALLKSHGDVHALEHKAQVAIEAGDAEAAFAAYTVFMEANEKHLIDEEGVMMPLVQKIAEKGTNMRAMVNEDILPCTVVSANEGDGMQFFLGFAMQMSEKYPGDNPRARVFAHATATIASSEQWKEWHPIIKANLSPELYAKVKAECDFADI